MSYTEQLKERDSLGNCAIFPQTNTNAQQINTQTLDMSKFNRAFFFGTVGFLAGNSNVQAYMQQGNNANASDATNFALTTNPALAVNIAVSNQVFTLEVRQEQMTAKFLRGCIAVGGNQGNVAGQLFGTVARYEPANAYDQANAVGQVNARIVAAV